jgi:hypothetical protein
VSEWAAITRIGVAWVYPAGSWRDLGKLELRETGYEAELRNQGREREEHIANAEKRPAIDRTCNAAGYRPSIVCTPEELLGDRYVD